MPKYDVTVVFQAQVTRRTRVGRGQAFPVSHADELTRDWLERRLSGFGASLDGVEHVEVVTVTAEDEPE